MASLDSKTKLIEIGVVGKPHGISGGVNLRLHNEKTDLTQYLDKLILCTTSSTDPIAIERIQTGSKGMIVVFENVQTRDQAKALVGSKILVRRADLPDPEPDEFYVEDIIGMAAFDGSNPIGTVIASTPQADIEVVTIANESVEVNVPLVERFVERIDFSRNRIILQRVDELPHSKAGRRE